MVPFAGFAAVLAWWFTLAPSHNRDWSVEYSRLPRADVEGDKLTIHDLRHFDYPSGGEPVPRWETRSCNLADLEGMDLAINFWGSPWIAHPIVIFRFKDAAPLAFSNVSEGCQFFAANVYQLAERTFNSDHALTLPVG